MAPVPWAIVLGERWRAPRGIFSVRLRPCRQNPARRAISSTCRNAQALDRAEFFEQRRLALLADAGKFIEDAFGDFLEPKLRVVGVGEPMGFVPHPLQEFERAGIVAQPQRFALAGPVNFLELLGQADDGNLAPGPAWPTPPSRR